MPHFGLQYCIKSLIFYPIFALFAEHAHASTREHTDAILGTMPWADRPTERDQRRDTAQAMLAYWEHFDTRVPRLSPEESDWLMSELGGDSERVSRALRSDEYALDQIGIHVDLCLRSLRRVHETLTGEDQNQTEMFYWVQSVHCWSQPDELVEHLRRADLSNGKYDGPFDLLMVGMFLDWTIDQLVPAAMADTMGWSYGAD